MQASAIRFTVDHTFYYSGLHRTGLLRAERVSVGLRLIQKLFEISRQQQHYVAGLSRPHKRQDIASLLDFRIERSPFFARNGSNPSGDYGGVIKKGVDLDRIAKTRGMLFNLGEWSGPDGKHLDVGFDEDMSTCSWYRAGKEGYQPQFEQLFCTERLAQEMTMPLRRADMRRNVSLLCRAGQVQNL